MTTRSRYQKLQASKRAARMSVLGRKGGPARAASLSPERRREIAMIANRARWKTSETTTTTTQ